MPVDNTIYDRLAATWWDPDGFLYAIRTMLNPGRVDYCDYALRRRLNLDLALSHVLDVGCGGGLLAEELGRMGCRVTGVDPSQQSIRSAKEHAASAALPIAYFVAPAERLPFASGTFDIVCCCDTLEHIEHLQEALAEIARVLKMGGVFIYDTVNRTLLTYLVVIKLLQEWKGTALMPPRFHDWRMFIKPLELREYLEGVGIENRHVVGFSRTVRPLEVLRCLRQCRRGRISYAEAGRRMALVFHRSTSLMYLGFGVKIAPAAVPAAGATSAGRAGPAPFARM